MNEKTVLVKKFVACCFKYKDDKAIAARLRRGVITERQPVSLPYIELADCRWDLIREDHRRIACVIAAMIANENHAKNGKTPFAAIMAEIYAEREERLSADGPGKLRLRRLLAARDVLEVCDFLWRVLRLIQQKSALAIDYELLITQLLMFNVDSESVKAQWTKDYFWHSKKEFDE